MAKLPKDKQSHVFAMAQRRARVAELYLSGKAQQEIAAEVGVSQMTVSTDLTALRKAWLRSLSVMFAAPFRKCRWARGATRTPRPTWLMTRTAATSGPSSATAPSPRARRR